MTRALTATALLSIALLAPVSRNIHGRFLGSAAAGRRPRVGARRLPCGARRVSAAARLARRRRRARADRASHRRALRDDGADARRRAAAVFARWPLHALRDGPGRDTGDPRDRDRGAGPSRRRTTRRRRGVLAGRPKVAYWKPTVPATTATAAAPPAQSATLAARATIHDLATGQETALDNGTSSAATLASAPATP